MDGKRIAHVLVKVDGKGANDLCAILESIDGVLAVSVDRGPSRDFERFEEIGVHLRVTPDVDSKQVREHFRQQTESWEMPRKWEFDH